MKTGDRIEAFLGAQRARRAELIAERGGSGYAEITYLLGHEPVTWEATSTETGSAK